MKQTFVRQVARRTNRTNKVPKSAKPPRGWGRKSLDLVMRRPTANTKGVVVRTAIMASTKAVSVRAMGGCVGGSPHSHPCHCVQMRELYAFIMFVQVRTAEA